MKLKRFVLEVVIDESYFDRDKKGRKVFRYRTRKEYFPLRAKNTKRARNKEKEVLRQSKLFGIITARLHKEIKF